MLKMENRHWQIVQQIINKYPYQFYAYGSRAKGTATRISDLDLCYYDDIPSYDIVQIEEDFIESDLPFEVEVVNWKHMRPAFQKAIQKDLVLLSAPKLSIKPNKKLEKLTKNYATY